MRGWRIFSSDRDLKRSQQSRVGLRLLYCPGMKLKAPMGFTLSVITGLVMGFIFGDLVFPKRKAAYGTPRRDIILEFSGAVISALIYEIVAAVTYEIARYIRDRT